MLDHALSTQKCQEINADPPSFTLNPQVCTHNRFFLNSITKWQGLKAGFQLPPATAAGTGTHQTALSLCESLGNPPHGVFFPCNAMLRSCHHSPRLRGECGGKEQLFLVVIGLQHLTTSLRNNVFPHEFNTLVLQGLIHSSQNFTGQQPDLESQILLMVSPP